MGSLTNILWMHSAERVMTVERPCGDWKASGVGPGRMCVWTGETRADTVHDAASCRTCSRCRSRRLHLAVCPLHLRIRWLSKGVMANVCPGLVAGRLTPLGYGSACNTCSHLLTFTCSHVHSCSHGPMMIPTVIPTFPRFYYGPTLIHTMILTTRSHVPTDHSTDTPC